MPKCLLQIHGLSTDQPQNGASSVQPQMARVNQTTTDQCHTKLPPDCCLVGAEAAHQDGQS